MAEQTILAVQFRLQPGSGHKEVFKQHLLTLFNILATEPAFVSAILHENLDRPEEILIYEIWHEGREEFLRTEMTKPYREPFEQLLAEFGIDRRVDWLTPIAEWGSTLTMAPHPSGRKGQAVTG